MKPRNLPFVFAGLVALVVTGALAVYAGFDPEPWTREVAGIAVKLPFQLAILAYLLGTVLARRPTSLGYWLLIIQGSIATFLPPEIFVGTSIALFLFAYDEAARSAEEVSDA